MTQKQRKELIERQQLLSTRIIELIQIKENVTEPGQFSQTLVDVIKEYKTEVARITKAVDAKYEFLYNFESGGWNSEYAYTLEEAQKQAVERWKDSTSGVNMKSFRVSTESDYKNLLSMFY